MRRGGPNGPAVQADAGAPELTVDGVHAVLRLRRPERRNALGAADIAAVVAACEAVDAQAGVRVLVLRAEGPVFCAGYDLKALAAQRGDAAALGFKTMVERVERVRVPTICALSGSVYGGGLDLALACDVRVGTPEIEARMTAARIGVQYYASGLRRAVAILGLGTAKRVFLAAEPLRGDDLALSGFLDDVVPAERLDARVGELAAAFASGAPAAVQAMKRALDAVAAGRADETALDRAFAASLASSDVAEGLAALRDGRTPIFAEPQG